MRMHVRDWEQLDTAIAADHKETRCLVVACSSLAEQITPAWRGDAEESQGEACACVRHAESQRRA
jgi:hypothetical protein